MTDWAAIITAAGTTIVPLGGGIGWLYRRVDARFKKVETIEQEITARADAAAKWWAANAPAIRRVYDRRPINPSK